MAVPKLRFSDFNKPWNTVFLGKIADITKLAGYEFTEHVIYTDCGKIIALRGLNVKNGKLILDDVKYIDESNLDKLNRSKLYINDLLLTYVGTIGEIAIIDEDNKYYLAPNVCRIRVEKEYTNSYFLMIQMSTLSFYKKIIYPLVATSSQPALSMENVRKFLVAYPELEEQKKIASFFSFFDQKIEKQQEKIEQLKLFKNGMMQKIFSQEIRFKDDNGQEFPEWEQTTLGKVTESLNYGLNAAAIQYDGENKYIRITDIDDQSHRYIEEHKVSPEGELTDGYLVELGDILLARTGASTGKSYLYKESDGKMYFAGFLIRARVKPDVDHRFVFFQFSTTNYQKWVKVMSMRSGQPGINATEYASFEFSLPVKEEQKKIADYLWNIDLKIEKETEKLKVLTELKKGFMQQMFI